MHRCSLRTLIVWATALPCTAGTFGAASAAEQTTAPVIVTATRTAQTADSSLAPVTVIDRETIERSQARSVDELLRSAPGIQITRNGGYGKTTNIFLRGSNANHVLVLIDGVRAASATLGSYAWHNLSPSQIERIEIVRGPRASLYGSDAIGGVIQIFTRQTTGVRAQIGAGGKGVREADVAAGAAQGDWRISAQAGHFETDGLPNTRADDQDRGFENNSLSVNAGGQLAGIRLDMNATQSDGRNENDSFTGNNSFTNRSYGLKLGQDISSVWSHSLRIGGALDRHISHSPFIPSTITTRRSSISWQHDISLGNSLLSAGFDHWIDRASKDNSGTFNVRIRTNAPFLQWQASSPYGDWILGLRQDRNSAAGRENTWNIGWGKDLTERWRLTASHGTAFKAPSVNDLYWPYSVDSYFGDTFITVGNPNLQPETSRSSELGLRWQAHTQLSFEAHAFYTEVDDLIDWVSNQINANTYQYTPSNISRARIRGAEFIADWRQGPWRAQLAYNLTDAEDRDRDQRLDRRPLHSGSLTVTRQWHKFDLQAEWLAASERKDQLGETTLGGYGLLNLRGGWQFQRQLRLEARVENLFDKRYALASTFSGDYRSLDRTFYMNLIYSYQ